MMNPGLQTFIDSPTNVLTRRDQAIMENHMAELLADVRSVVRREQGHESGGRMVLWTSVVMKALRIARDTGKDTHKRRWKEFAFVLVRVAIDQIHDDGQSPQETVLLEAWNAWGMDVIDASILAMTSSRKCLSWCF